MSRSPRTMTARTKSVLLNLAILAVVLVVLRFGFGITFNPVLMGAVAGAIALPMLFPARYEELASGLAWLGLAAVAYFYFGSQLLGVVAGIIGVFSLMAAVAGLRASQPAGPAR
jgi:hypothetical protein